MHVLAISKPQLSSNAHQLEVFQVGTRAGMLFAALAGALAITAEIRYGTIRPTFLIEPRRSPVIAAKLMPGGAGLSLAGNAHKLSIAFARPPRTGRAPRAARHHHCGRRDRVSRPAHPKQARDSRSRTPRPGTDEATSRSRRRRSDEVRAVRLRGRRVSVAPRTRPQAPGPPPAWIESNAQSRWLAYGSYCWNAPARRRAGLARRCVRTWCRHSRVPTFAQSSCHSAGLSGFILGFYRGVRT
jgi:hypothetical protein